MVCVMPREKLPVRFRPSCSRTAHSASFWKADEEDAMRLIWLFGFLLAVTVTAVAHAADSRCAASVDHFQPKYGVVSDPNIAVAVAAAYLMPIYGEAQIRRQMPLRAKLADQTWTVNGTLSRGSIGGTAQIIICQRNGAVLSIIHYK